MTKENTGGPAPTFFTDAHAASMTLRDYFAAKAMQSFLLNQKPEHTDEPATYWAQSAYEFADAMLEVREE